MILVVAATAFEAALAEARGAETVVCGIGPLEAGLATSRALAEWRPDAVLQIGIAGAQTLANGSVVIGSEAVYCDILDSDARIPRVERILAHEALLTAAKRALPDAHVLPIGTTAHVGGGVACEVEAMEGFGVLRAAQLEGVPALELRTISNAVAERDREKWNIDDAIRALDGAVGLLLEALTLA